MNRAEEPSEKVLGIMAKPDADLEDMFYAGAGHAFLFQYAKAFTKQVGDFLAA